VVRTGVQSRNDSKARGAKRPAPARPRPASARPPRPAAAVEPNEPAAPRLGWREAIEKTVTGLHYELVDIERVTRGLLRVTLDRVPGHVYSTGDSEFVLVEDCELVTRQLQYALEVEGLEYTRLEVSSPGLDRPLKREADYARFAGQEIAVTLKVPFNGRKTFKGVLGRGAEGAGWQLVFSEGKTEQVLGFAFDEVREARLVPVLDFKGRRKPAAAEQPGAAPPLDGG
jgi:ribosome maturation factor RimP